jgi:hypothetical protein
MTESRDETTRQDDAEWQVVEQGAYDRAKSFDLTAVIVEAVAAAEGVDVTDIGAPPLYDVVDVSAIEDSFFGPSVTGECRDSLGSVDFEFRGFRVTVRSDGWVQVAERGGRRS